MANNIVQLQDKAGNNIFPIAGGMAADSITTAMLQDGAVTGGKIGESAWIKLDINSRTWTSNYTWGELCNVPSALKPMVALLPTPLGANIAYWPISYAYYPSLEKIYIGYLSNNVSLSLSLVSIVLSSDGTLTYNASTIYPSS